jgi:integrase
MRPRTAREVAALKAPGTHRVDRNLYVQITESGTRSWLFRYTRDGVAHGMGLGPLDLVSLAEARDKALDARRQLLNGIDPLGVRRAQRQQALLDAARRITFQECADRYIAAYAAGWRNAKHKQQWENTLRDYTYPVIGPLAVADIDTTLVLKVLEPIWETKAVTAHRLRGRIERILDWAKANSYRQGENPARWRGHLAQILPALARKATVNHHEALPYAEIPAFMAALRAQDGIPARCLEFTILTATRHGEARGAQWAEIDPAARTWTIPAERMKTGKKHTVPLSARVLTLLADMPRAGSYIFENGRAGRPFRDKVVTAVLEQSGRPGVTVHGFRSTFRDWAAEQTHYQNHVVEMALAHAIGDKVEAAYRRGDLLQKRRDLMQDWAVYCTG